MIIKVGPNDKNIIEFERDEFYHIYFDGNYFYNLYKVHFDDNEMYINTYTKYKNMVEVSEYFGW